MFPNFHPGSGIHSQSAPIVCAGGSEWRLWIRGASFLFGRKGFGFVPDRRCCHFTSSTWTVVVWICHTSSVPLGGAVSPQTAASQVGHSNHPSNHFKSAAKSSYLCMCYIRSTFGSPMFRWDFTVAQTSMWTLKLERDPCLCCRVFLIVPTSLCAVWRATGVQ